VSVAREPQCGGLPRPLNPGMGQDVPLDDLGCRSDRHRLGDQRGRRRNVAQSPGDGLVVQRSRVALSTEPPVGIAAERSISTLAW